MLYVQTDNLFFSNPQKVLPSKIFVIFDPNPASFDAPKNPYALRQTLIAPTCPAPCI